MNWLHRTKAIRVGCLAVIWMVGASPCSRLEGQSDQSAGGIIKHEQIVPNGWSAINSNLETADSRIVSLMPEPPEGTLFFKLTSAGTWDVNQFQWGRWNFADQTILAGDSGVLFNPGEPWLLSWEGIPKSIDAFTGYLSGATPISKEIFESASFGASVTDFTPLESPASMQFADRYDTSNISVFFGIWAPDFSPISEGDHQRVILFQSPEWGAKTDTDRTTGSHVYVNNYLPGFDSDWRLHPERFPTGFCSAESIENSFPPVVSLKGKWLEHEIPVINTAPQAGYLDVSRGTTFTLVGDNTLSITHTSLEVNATIINKPGELHPPVVLSGVEPKQLTHPNNLPEPQHLAPPCPIEIDFDQDPSDLQAIEGADIVIPTGVCDLDAHAGIRAMFDEYITFSLHKLAQDGFSERVVDSVDHQSFVLENVTPFDSGEYYISYWDSTADPDCFMWNFSIDVASEIFEITVVPKQTEPSLAIISDGGYSRIEWNGIGRLQEAGQIDGPWQDSVIQPGVIPFPVSDHPIKFFRIINDYEGN